MSEKIIKDFEDVLNLAEDYLSGGIRRNHDGEKQEDSLAAIAEEIKKCRKCRLCETRTNTVPGEGVLNPKVMIIGEGPGAEEDKTGRPFVGKAGRYMDKWMDAIDLKRDRDLFIGNIVKCRPPGNRDPFPDEIEACQTYLHRQIELIKPRLILSVGRIASQFLVNSSLGIGRLRGRMYEYRGIPLVPTYHPSGVLRNPDDYRKPVWEDLKTVRAFLQNTE